MVSDLKVKHGNVRLAICSRGFARIRLPLGRRPGLTPDVHASIVRDVGAGHSYPTAVRKAGFSVSTGYAWLKRGRAEEDTIYSRFVVDVERAKAGDEIALTNNMRDLADEGHFAAIDYWIASMGRGVAPSSASIRPRRSCARE